MSWEGGSDPYWIDPFDIEYKISPVSDLHGIKDGDWDIDRRHLFSETVKSVSVTEHFLKGRPWVETKLFTEVYSRRLEKDGNIGRCRSLKELSDEYERRFGLLYRQLKTRGFRTNNGNGKLHALPSFLIGRDGDIFIGNQGNHRLAMAKVLGLREIAGKIVCRHKNWIE